MAKKKKRVQRRDAPTATGQQDPRTDSPDAEMPAIVAPKRRVERMAASKARMGRSPTMVAADFAPLPPDDAAIPFDRVPYVPADLRRVAVMAAVMILIIVIAAIVVPRIVGT